ncbi:MAG: hypothetical protein IJQ00_04750, partial [Kiritimatiellae bacterium]|nr:hypothetical protein [Kiritimatiellia bacterium]
MTTAYRTRRRRARTGARRPIQRPASRPAPRTTRTQQSAEAARPISLNQVRTVVCGAVFVTLVGLK